MSILLYLPQVNPRSNYIAKFRGHPVGGNTANPRLLQQCTCLTPVFHTCVPSQQEDVCFSLSISIPTHSVEQQGIHHLVCFSQDYPKHSPQWHATCLHFVVVKWNLKSRIKLFGHICHRPYNCFCLSPSSKTWLQTSILLLLSNVAISEYPDWPLK